MTLAIPSWRPTAPEFPAHAQAELAAEASWHQWIFKAPPLEVAPPQVDLRVLGEALASRAAIAR